jgi:hypothetical protein
MASRTLATVILKGAPPLRPRARAEERPALIRSEISSRSNSESGEYTEDQLAGRSGRINGGTVSGEDFEANTSSASRRNGRFFQRIQCHQRPSIFGDFWEIVNENTNNNAQPLGEALSYQDLRGRSSQHYSEDPIKHVQHRQHWTQKCDGQTPDF